MAYDLEEEFGAGLGEENEAQLVDDEELEAGKLLLDVEQALLVSGFYGLVKPPDRPLWQAARPSPSATWVLPVPLLPIVMTFPRRWMYSHRASSKNRCLFTEVMARRSKVSRLFTAGKRARPDPPLHHAVVVVYGFKLGQPEQEAGVVCLSASHWTAILPYSLRKVGSFNSFRWCSSNTVDLSLITPFPTVGPYNLWGMFLSPWPWAGCGREPGQASWAYPLYWIGSGDWRRRS